MYNRFGRTLRRAYRLVHPRWRVDPTPIDGEGAVYLVHHQNMYGPMHVLGLMPEDLRMWTLSCFTDPQACFRQFYQYTYRDRYGWPKPVAWSAARAFSGIVPRIMRSVGCIPVYRGEANTSTVRQSLQALEAGEGVAICLDRDYASEDASVGEVYSGFLMLGKLYERRCGRPLPFVPVHVSGCQRRIVFDQPLHVDTQAPFADVQTEMARAIVASMNAMAVACGDVRGGR